MALTHFYFSRMAQITIYLPEGLARQVKQRARRAHKSLSAYIASLATEGGAQAVTRNVAEFARVPGLRVDTW